MRRKAYHPKPPSLAKAKRCRPYIYLPHKSRQRKASTVKLSPPQPSAAQPSPAQSSSAKPAKPTLAHRNLASADKQREAGKFILAQPHATLLNPAQLSPSPA